MVETAVQLCTYVLPEVPLRQWVLTVPPPMRYLLAYDSALLAEVMAIFVQAVFAHSRSVARRELALGKDMRIECGAICVPQRFNSALGLKNEFTGVLTGKGLSWGGSLIRTEATGYGATYFAQEMLATKGDSLKGKTCVISGAGNVGLHVIEKVNQLGGKVVAMTDYDGTVVDMDGINDEKLAWTKDLVFVRRGSLKRYVDNFPKAQWLEGKKSWGVKCDIAFPTACENELDGEAAKQLIANGCMCVAEGANMPSTPEAVEVFLDKKILFAPGKAANAGGVATSGLEMAQNAMHLSWTAEEVDQRLHQIMKAIHKSCVTHGAEKGKDFVNYVTGANVAGFIKVADAMLAQGVV